MTKENAVSVPLLLPSASTTALPMSARSALQVSPSVTLMVITDSDQIRSTVLGLTVCACQSVAMRTEMAGGTES